MQSKSREWLEAECLRLAKRAPGGREIERVTIKRLSPKGTGPNWKVADLIPQPTFAVSSARCARTSARRICFGGRLARRGLQQPEILQH
jgi:hypothetical protein